MSGVSDSDPASVLCAAQTSTRYVAAVGPPMKLYLVTELEVRFRIQSLFYQLKKGRVGRRRLPAGHTYTARQASVTQYRNVAVQQGYPTAPVYYVIAWQVSPDPSHMCSSVWYCNCGQQNLDSSSLIGIGDHLLPPHILQELAQRKADRKAREAEDKEERAAARALEARARRAAAAAAAAQKAAAFGECKGRTRLDKAQKQ